MNHNLPAVCLSSFIFLHKKTLPLPKDYSQGVKFKNSSQVHSIPKFTSIEKLSVVAGAPAPGLRVVAVRISNNTDQTITLKNNLRITLANKPGEAVDFIPPVLPKREATSVFFLYNLLRQRLPYSAPLSSENQSSPTADVAPESAVHTVKNVFMASTLNRDIAAELKEAYLLNKTLSPGQTLSGLILLLTASAEPLKFYLNF